MYRLDAVDDAVQGPGLRVVVDECRVVAALQQQRDAEAKVRIFVEQPRSASLLQRPAITVQGARVHQESTERSGRLVEPGRFGQLTAQYAAQIGDEIL